MRERRRVLLIEHDPDDHALVTASLDQTDYALQTAEGEAQGLSLAPQRAGSRRQASRRGGARGADERAWQSLTYVWGAN